MYENKFESAAEDERILDKFIDSEDDESSESEDDIPQLQIMNGDKTMSSKTQLAPPPYKSSFKKLGHAENFAPSNKSITFEDEQVGNAMKKSSNHIDLNSEDEEFEQAVAPNQPIPARKRSTSWKKISIQK